jgi:excisionase family DNA binding protein
VTSRLTVSVREAALMTGIGRDRLYALVAARELPALRSGRTIRIPTAALSTWVDQAAQEGRRV